MKVITHTLYAGDPSDASYMIDLVPVANATEAVDVILSGGCALLPLKHWKRDATTVLRSFHCSDEHIESQLHLAEHGSLR
jgi:hypothetical protein